MKRRVSIDIVICTYNNAARLAGAGLVVLARDAFKSGFDLTMAFGPAAGWCAAMWEMIRMDAVERCGLLGCAAPHKPDGEGMCLREKGC